MTNEPECGIVDVSEKELKLLELLRATRYGQVIIYLESGQPVRVEKVKESIKL